LNDNVFCFYIIIAGIDFRQYVHAAWASFVLISR